MYSFSVKGQSSEGFGARPETSDPERQTIQVQVNMEGFFFAGSFGDRPRSGTSFLFAGSSLGTDLEAEAAHHFSLQEALGTDLEAEAVHRFSLRGKLWGQTSKRHIVSLA
ncbi:hypothetical protein PilKf_02158 [Pillotina sp. SPG140]